MVKAYSYMTILIFVLGSAATGFSLYLTWSERSFCTTIDGTKTCLESNLSTGSKIGFTIGSILQWLIDLCEYSHHSRASPLRLFASRALQFAIQRACAGSPLWLCLLTIFLQAR